MVLGYDEKVFLLGQLLKDVESYDPHDCQNVMGVIEELELDVTPFEDMMNTLLENLRNSTVPPTDG